MTYEYNHLRYMARIVVETLAPLKIGSGEAAIKTDATVSRDVNRLPYIPGTTIAGLLRHAMPKELRADIMGFQNREAGEGSRLTVSEARLVGIGGKVIDGLLNRELLTEEERQYVHSFEQLPIRQHVRINHRGTAVEHGKFDEEVVPRGARFCFELELRSDTDMQGKFDALLKTFSSTSFRIGGGSRKGFGKIVVRALDTCSLDLCREEDLRLYIEKQASLSARWAGYIHQEIQAQSQDAQWIHYELRLKPQDMIFFGSGLGNKHADMSVVSEQFIEWSDNNEPTWYQTDQTILIPASSVKGALAHRMAYHYNKAKEIFADKIAVEYMGDYIGKVNEAVHTLFGMSGERGEDMRRGCVLLSDVLQLRQPATQPKVLNHVKIDRFTGGTIDGALFSEQPLYAVGEEFKLSIEVERSALAEETVEQALERSLEDICAGILPLGGGVNRGNGIFHGTLIKDGVQIYG